MERYVGPAWLDWQANSAMVFGGPAVTVEITHDDGVWHAWASLVDRSPEDLDALELFHGADPYFTLRFPDESEVWVKVGDIADPDRIELTEHKPEDHAAS